MKECKHNYYARIIRWVKDVVNDELISDEEKIGILGRVL